MESHQFGQVLGALMSADNATRNQAEQLYQSNLLSNAGQTTELLATHATNNEFATRTMALVLLRQVIRNNAAWDSVDGATKQAVKAMLVKAIDQFQTADVRTARKAVYCLVSFPTNELERMDDLVPFAFKLGSPALTLFFLDKLAEYCFAMVNKHLQQVVTSLTNCLQQGAEVQTMLQAGKTMCSIMLSHPRPVDMKRVFEQLLPSMMTALVNGLQESHDEANRLLEELIVCASKCIFGFDKYLEDSCMKLLQIVQSTDLEQDQRCLAMELFVEIFKKRGKNISANMNFMENLLKLMLELQMQDVDFEDEFSHEMQPSEDVLLMLIPGLRGTALMALSELSGNVHDDKAFVEKLLMVVSPAFGNDAPWKSKLAAVSSVGAIVENQKKTLKSIAPKIFGSLESCFNVDNQSVLFMTISTLELLIYNGCFEFEENPLIAQQVLQILLSLLESGQAVPAVISNGCQCLAHFLAPGVCPLELLSDEQFVHRLLKALINQLTGNLITVKRDALLALGKLATSQGEKFGPYYGELLTGIMGIISGGASQLGDPEKEGILRAAAMSCVGSLAEASGRDRFKADAPQVMNVILQQINPDDFISLDGFFDFCKRVCSVLEDDFLPFLEPVLNLIIKASKADIGTQVQAVDEEETSGQQHAEQGAGGQFSAVMNLRGAGAFRATINSYALEVRISALEALDSIVDTLGPLFAPYLDTTLEAVLPAVGDRLNVNAAIAAAEASASMLFSAWKSLFESGHSMEPAQKLLVTIIVPLLTGLEAASTSIEAEDEHEMSAEQRIGFASALERCFRICYVSGGDEVDGVQPKPTLVPPPQLLPQILTVLRDILAYRIRRRQVLEETLTEQGYERDDIEEFMEESEDLEQEFTTDVIDSIGYIIKMYREEIIPLFDSVINPLLSAMIQGNQPSCFQTNGICLYDDIFEFCGSVGAKYLDLCFPLMLEYSAHGDDTLLLQACVYGFGQVLEHHASYFASHTDQVLRILVGIITNPDAKEEENLGVTENAISVLGKILHLNKQQPQQKELCALWLSNLPLYSDEQEAKFTHRLLAQQTQQQNPILMQHKDQVLKIFKDLQRYKNKTVKLDTDIDIMDDSTANLIQQLLAQ